MSIFDFWADPVDWFLNQFTWFLTSPLWFVALNILFWPACFVKPWVEDRLAARKRRRRHAARQMAG